VADHARRSTCEYPLCQGSYYGVNYGGRARRGVPENERPSKFLPPHCGGVAPCGILRTIFPGTRTFHPLFLHVPGQQGGFFWRIRPCRASRHRASGDHHIAPGKKQWTWGNHAFGYAWDRNLTDNDGPYIELMAGVTRTISRFFFSTARRNEVMEPVLVSHPKNSGRPITPISTPPSIWNRTEKKSASGSAFPAISKGGHPPGRQRPALAMAGGPGSRKILRRRAGAAECFAGGAAVAVISREGREIIA